MILPKHVWLQNFCLSGMFRLSRLQLKPAATVFITHSTSSISLNGIPSFVQWIITQNNNNNKKKEKKKKKKKKKKKMNMSLNKSAV